MGVPEPPVYPEPTILSISTNGEVYLEWNVIMEPIDDLGLLTKRSLSQTAIDLNLEPGSSETRPQDLAIIDFEVTEVENRKMTIKIDLKTPEFVSSSKPFD
jgi:hypothetical protein